MSFIKITENIFAVGGPNLSKSEDAMVFCVITKEKSIVLIDCGVNSMDIILKNIKDTGNAPDKLEALILTHCHIDHIGSAFNFKQDLPKIKIFAHEWDQPAIEGKKGTERSTAANWYGIIYKPVKVDVVITKIEEDHNISGTSFLFIHTPGHTPGSISIIVKDEGKKILFGQDIHGPFMKEFNSNICDWRNSMKLLLSKKCDYLCEGHFGIYKSNLDLERYIKSQLMQHEDRGE